MVRLRTSVWSTSDPPRNRVRPRAAVNRPSRDGPSRANAYRSPQTEAPNSLPPRVDTARILRSRPLITSSRYRSQRRNPLRHRS